MKTLMIKRGYNYTTKVVKALEEGNLKYIEMLIKKGKVIPIDFPKENYIDLTGEFGCPSVSLK